MPFSNATGASILLRILLWKLGFEWANLMRLINPRTEQKIYYFAFGANLSPHILKQRNMTVYQSIDYALEDAALRFTQSGFYKDHGFASADHAPGEKVYGRLYLIKQSDAARMDYYEGVPFLKAHDKVLGEYNGLPFYYYRARTITQDLKPTQEYLDYLTNAYHEMDIVPKSYTKAMEATEVLNTRQPLTITGKFIDNLNRWPTALHPLLIKYEGLCRKTVERFWNSSLLTWMIKD